MPFLIALSLCLVALTAGAQAHGGEASGATTEVVVTLASPPLAGDRSPAARARLDAEQAAFLRRLKQAIPDAKPRWRYRLVANGFAVVLPERAIPLVRALPGVRDVYASARYTATLDRSVPQIGAPQLWGSALETAGAGIKIAIIDTGVDHSHRFFNPAGYTMPPGFPKGQQEFTTAKVIVARVFPPPGVPGAEVTPADRHGHGTHVAGIAAGDADTRAGARILSGVAPRAYLGNYKVLTVPLPDGSPDGNSPEIVAAVEAAVVDGMDVLNLSIGEPEIPPSRDIVALALDAAAGAGVVPVVAAGNEHAEFGRGSVWSPATAAKAITVGAVTTRASGAEDQVEDFSSAGPSTLSLRLKPEVSAPGAGILSSVPGGWATFSGTSMASPHVAGAAALMRQRHPSWAPAQVKAALVATASTAFLSPTRPAPPSRAGAGVVDLPQADLPLILAEPSALSFGLVRSGTTATASVTLADAGGGAGAWTAAIELREGAGTTTPSIPASITVPGVLPVAVTAPAGAAQGEVGGLIVLTRNGSRRVVPFWFRVTTPALGRARPTPLPRPGIYRGTNRGKPALASSYRYPDVPLGADVTATLAGPEHVFRVVLARPAENFGVVVIGSARGVRVEPRIVAAGDENRLTGFAALPYNNNPYLEQYGQRVPASGAVKPTAGSYDVVFDSATAAGAGSFRFRFWLNDMTPPTARLAARSVRRGTALRVRVADAGAGIDPRTLSIEVDGADRTARLRGGIVQVPTTGLGRGRHRLRLQLSDYQESRNMENVARILPNTRVLTATFTVRG
jgi:subtilisin family serine protease